MMITVPDEWRERFAQFETAERILRANYAGEGVSRVTISKTFAAYAGVNSCWQDPAFRVWAALRGCTSTSGFLARWDRESEPAADDATRIAAPAESAS